jgi:hypothetical protein
MAADLIDDFLARLTRTLPAAAEVAPRLEAELRQHWGGTERTYIRKRPAPDQRTASLGQALQRGLPLGEAFAAAGISRATGFRHLGKRAK